MRLAAAGGTLAAMAAALLAITGCEPTREASAEQVETATLAAREARLDSALARPDSAPGGGTMVAHWLLPASLKEISGVVLGPDGRLFAHGDERGVVWEIDYRRGEVLKEFSLGNPAIHGDFESIAIAGGEMFLLTSKGKLYAFHEGEAGATVPYTMEDTGLRDVCELEGMAADTTAGSLLFACKHVLVDGLKDSVVIFRWKIVGEAKRGLDLPRLTIPRARVIGTNAWKGVHPSDLTIDPHTGNYVLIASTDKAIIEVTPKGEVVQSRTLPGEHEQPEGVAVTKDGILIVSDEGRPGTPAAIALYRWPLKAGGAR